MIPPPQGSGDPLNQENPELDVAFRRLEDLVNAEAQGTATTEQICAELSNLFGVRSREVALLRIDGYFLKFVFPPELTWAGSVPLSGCAVASRTASTAKAEIFNSFLRVQHLRVFEVARMRDPEDSSDQHEMQPIQKLMSAPLIGRNTEVVGVVQVCRKGRSPVMAGPDFTQDDLKKLERAAVILGQLIAQDPTVARG